MRGSNSAISSASSEARRLTASWIISDIERLSSADFAQDTQAYEALDRCRSFSYRQAFETPLLNAFDATLKLIKLANKHHQNKTCAACAASVVEAPNQFVYLSIVAFAENGG